MIVACYAKLSHDGEVSMCPLGSTVCWMPFFSSAPTLGMSLYVRAAVVLYRNTWSRKLEETAGGRR